MIFVAQPYEQFADDLLTALTGGMVREEHQFVGVEEPYILASPGVLSASMKVFGQRNNTFAFFGIGIDYVYDSKQEAVVWKSDGKFPDEHSFFYVNYYLQEGQRRLTDRNPGSVTTTMAEAFAREFSVLHKQMEMIYRSAFVDLAAGTSLDHVAALLGLIRKDAKFARGEVLFKRNTPAPGDITIPAGTLVSTDQGQNFETSDKRTLRKGQLSMSSSIQAQVEGPAGKVEAGAIKNINRPIFGIDSVMNEEATFFATEKETDAEFRRRIKGTLERAGKSTLNAIKFGLIEDIPEITEGNIQVAERAEVPGFVEVKLGLELPGDTDVKQRLVQSIEESIFYSRAAGIHVTHNLLTRSKSESVQRAETKQPTTIPEVTPRQDKGARMRKEATHLPQKVLRTMEEGMLKVRAKVFLRLAEQNLSVVQKENILDSIRSRVVDYIEALPMGADLIYNKLLGCIVQTEEVLDASLGIDVEGMADTLTENLATDGRKARVADPLRDIVVALMEETVFIDILVYVTSQSVESPTENDKTKITQELVESQTETDKAEVPQELKDKVENVINETFVKAQNEVSKETLKKKIRDSIQSDQEAKLQLIEGNAIILNAEYEETGRLLNNTDKVSLEEHQVPELRKFEIEKKGVLDGQI